MLVLSPRSLVGTSLHRQVPMRRSVCMSKLTDSAELSSFAAAQPPQKPARQRAESSTAEASTPPVTPVPELSLTIGDKTVSAVGLWMGCAVFLTAIAVQLPILAAWLYSEAFDDPPRTGTRRGIDSIIGFWAFASMSMSGYRPRVVGVENLPEGAAAGSKCPPWQCRSSPPVPAQRAPGGSGQLGTPRARPSHWAPSHRLGNSSERPPKDVR